MRAFIGAVLACALLYAGPSDAAPGETSPAPAAPAAPNTVAPAGAPAPGAIIEPGDVLSVQVYDEQALTQNVTVARDGSIQYPMIGRIVLSGVPADVAGARMAERFRRYIKHPLVTVAIVSEGSLTVQVLGNVKTPGKYVLRPDGRVLDAIAAAGGLGPVDGPLPDARVSVGAHSVKTIALDKLVHDGDAAENSALADGSVVYVPSPRQINVRVLGAVDHPGDIAIGEGDRLSLAVAKAGNSATANADLNHISVTRVAADGKPQAFQYNLYKELKSGDLSADPVLTKGDLVYVPQTSTRGHDTAMGGLFSILGSLLRFGL